MDTKNKNLYKITKIKQLLRLSFYTQSTPEELAIKLFNHVYLCRLEGEWKEFICEIKGIGAKKLGWSKLAYKKPSKKMYLIKTPYDIYKKCEIEDFLDACNSMIDQMLLMQELSEDDFQKIRKKCIAKTQDWDEFSKKFVLYINQKLLDNARKHTFMKKIYLVCDRKNFENKQFDATEYEVNCENCQYFIKKRFRLQVHLDLSAGHL